MSGGGGGTNTVQKSDPWDRAQPYLATGMEQTANLANQQIPYYQGTRVAPVDDRQIQSINMTTQRALNGSPVTAAAQQEAMNTVGGAYLSTDAGANPYTGTITGGTNAYSGSNPFLNNAIQSASNDVIRNYQTGAAAQLDRAAAQANAFGNSGYSEALQNNQRTLGQNLSNLTNSMRMQDYTTQQQLAESGLNRNMQAQLANANLAESQLGRGLSLYNAERQRQIQGLMFSPQLAQADYMDASMLGQAGDAARNLQQQNLNDYLQRYNEQAFMPYTQLDYYRNNIMPFAGMGGTTTMTNPSTSSGLGGAVAGGLLGYTAAPAVAGALGGAEMGAAAGPWGALIGAGLGYMMSR
jgi:hypothetical protein